MDTSGRRRNAAYASAGPRAGSGSAHTLLALAALTTSACGGGEPPGSDDTTSPAGWTLETARVVYESRGPDGSVLQLLDRGTGEVVGLTPTGDRNWAARVSPDGVQMLFNSLRDGDYEVYVGPIGGAAVRNVTRHADYDIVGAWSPDGSRVAFMSTRGYELGGDDGPFPGHVYVTDTSGGDPRAVTRRPLSSSFGPTDWSPDGRRLAMARDFDGQVDVVLIDVASGDEHRITTGPAAEYGASFSHDGTRLAFHADDGSTSRIVVAAVDGEAPRYLTEGFVDYEPRWSPDDRWLMVTRRGGTDPDQYDVVAVNVEDGTVVPLVATPVDERGASWVPNR